MAENHGACPSLTYAHSFMDAAYMAVKHSDGASLYVCNVDLTVTLELFQDAVASDYTNFLQYILTLPQDQVQPAA